MHKTIVSYWINRTLTPKLIFGFVCLCLFSQVYAETDTKMQPDAQRGAQLVTTCAACHGPDGVASIIEYPNLAGQHYEYLLHELKEIQSNERAIPLMTGQLDNMSLQDLADIAQYYSELDTPRGQADPEYLNLGRHIYVFGIKELRIPSCASCHGPTGLGVGTANYPAMAGQSETYVVKRLKEFRDRDPSSAKDDLPMVEISNRLNIQQMKAVANYMQGLYDLNDN